MKNYVLLGLSCTMIFFTVGCNEFVANGRNSQAVRAYNNQDYDGALKRAWQASSKDPRNADAYYNIAATHHQKGRVTRQPIEFEHAERFYNQCLDLNPNHRDSYRGLAVMLKEQNRQEDAFKLLQGWVARNQYSADAKIELARLYEENRDKESAKRYLQEAVALDSKNSDALLRLGKINEELGDYRMALANYSRSLEHQPNQPELRTRIASLQTQVGPGYGQMPVSPVTPSRTVSRPIGTTRF